MTSSLHDFMTAQKSPIIVRIIEPPHNELRDVLLGALGVTGAIVLVALVLGVLVGGLMFWMRSRSQ
jgi:hypothetical protein